MEDYEYKVSNYMQLYPRILVNVLVILVNILVNLLVKTARVDFRGAALLESVRPPRSAPPRRQEATLSSSPSLPSKG